MRSRAVAPGLGRHDKGSATAARPLPDLRPEAIAQSRLQALAAASPQARGLASLSTAVNAGPRLAAQRQAAAPLQAKWHDGSVTVSTRAEMEAQMGVPTKHVDEKEPAGQSLLDATVFLVPPAATLKG